MNRIAIIPARSGSKGVPNKNIIDFCGKPLMVHTIDAAKNSGIFDRIIVSTDSEEYAEIARNAGAEAVMRPPELATDTASSYVVIEHVLTTCLKEKCDYFVLLQVTSPMRTEQHILEATTLYEQNVGRDIDSVVSVMEAALPSRRLFTIDADNTLKNAIVNPKITRRQDEAKEYAVNGALYIMSPDAYLESKTFVSAKTLAYHMSDTDSVDIDNWLDFEFAKLLMEKRMHKNK